MFISPYLDPTNNSIPNDVLAYLTPTLDIYIHSKLGFRPKNNKDNDTPNGDSSLGRSGTRNPLSGPSSNAHETEGGGPIMQQVSRRSHWGALISRKLPIYKGPHTVGVFDMEIPVKEPSNIGAFRYRDIPLHEGGFKLETVLFSVFYPCEKPQSLLNIEKVVWFPKLAQTVNGFLKMARRTGWLYKTLAYPIAALAIYGTTFPALPEAPLKQPPKGKQWPLVIFSHGVGCSRLMYSQFCGEMASRGYIVVAVEHRDGTGPSSSIKLVDGTIRDLEFVNWQDLDWPELSPDDQPKDDTTLRHDQLEMRAEEIREIIAAMQGISKGEPIVETSLRSPHFDWSRWGPKWNAMEVEKPIMTGHSLGGSVALLAAARRDKFDFKSVVAMDPAIQRLEPWTGEIHCPLLCINSEEYTLSADYERLQGVAQTAHHNPPIYSIAGSTHPSFSDVFVIVPGFINRRTGLKVDAEEMLDTTMDITLDFLMESHVPVRTQTQRVREWAGPQTPLSFEPGTVFWHAVDDPDDEGDIKSVEVDVEDAESATEMARAKSKEKATELVRN